MDRKWAATKMHSYSACLSALLGFLLSLLPAVDFKILVAPNQGSTLETAKEPEVHLLRLLCLLPPINDFNIFNIFTENPVIY